MSPIRPRKPTLGEQVKDLTQQLHEVTGNLEDAQLRTRELEAALETARAAVADAEERAAAAQAEAAEAIAAAQADADAQVAAANAAAHVAQTALQAAQAQATAAGGPPAPQAPDILIPRPLEPFNIRQAMGIPAADYGAILRSIRGLTVQARLDWTEDFRRQDPEKLAMVFRAAREQHPVLKNYENNWPVASIVRQYMANRRKYAVKNGFIQSRHGRRGPEDRHPGPPPPGAAGAAVN